MERAIDKFDKYIVSTFYKICTAKCATKILKKLANLMKDNNVYGTILLSKNDGINGTISGKKSDLEIVYNFLHSFEEFLDIVFRETESDFIPFGKVKVKYKKEVVKMSEDISYDPGDYLSGNDWDNLITDKKTVVIDTRNDYEYDIGTFANAINPNIKKFSEFPSWFEKYCLETNKDTPIAMFCTGGVRCEKTTSYVRSLGFKKVYHLKDGIIGYLLETKNKNGKWKGDCFVFDDRVVLDYK